MLRSVPKFPIKVFSRYGDNESYRYASQIRKMLNEAGFGTNGEQVIETAGIVREWENAPNQFNNFDIGCFWYGTDKTTTLVDATGYRPLPNNNVMLVGTNSVGVFAVVMWVFDRIEIHPSGGDDDFLLKPGEFGVFVPPKIH
jgi:hypothetical protein